MALRMGDGIVILMYLCLMVVIAYLVRKHVKNPESFLVANRNLGFKMLFPCLAALTLGGGSTLGSTGLGYRLGLSGTWFLISLGCACLVMAILAPKISRLRIYTIAEMLELRYGAASRTFGAIIMSVYLVCLSSVGIISIGTVFSVLFGIDPVVAMIIGGAVAIAYCLIGGMVAITITDVIQWVFMTCSMFFILLPSAISTAGGFDSLTANLEPSYFSMTSLGFGGTIFYFMLYTLGTPIDQSGWQRVLTSKSVKTTVVSELACSGYTVAYGFTMVTVGMCAAVIMPGVERVDQVFTLMAVTILPSGVGGFVIAGALSAIMSTLDGPLLGASTVLVNDIIRPSLKQPMTDVQSIKLARIFLVVYGIAGLIVACWLQGVLLALDFAYLILAGALTVPILLGLYWKRATAKAATISIAAGLIAVCAGIAFYSITSLYPILWGMGSGLVAFVVCSYITKPEDGYERLNARRIEKDGAI